MAHANSAVAGLSALDRIDVTGDAPLADRRAPASGHATRGLTLAIGGRHADEFFAELTPYAHSPSLLYALQLADDPIRSRFADDARHGALIRALQSP